MPETLTIRRPYDFHVHLRRGKTLKQVLPATASVFARALVMPNAKPAILTWDGLMDYWEEIEEAAGDAYPGFNVLMTVQITARTTVQTIRECGGPPCFAGKLYPADVTTNSENGVRDFEALFPIFEAMEEQRMVLCLHGETPGRFCLDRELIFLETLVKLARTFPKLKIVLEHISTMDAVQTVRALPDTVAATITAHHMVLTLDDVIGDTLHPHHFCKPVPKTPDDRDALIRAATSGDPKFFFGSDSAPHYVAAKESADGAAGVFSAPVALPVLAAVFEKAAALDKLEPFASEHGARFYGLPLNEGTVTLEKRPWRVPDRYGDGLVPFMAGQTLDWSVR